MQADRKMEPWMLRDLADLWGRLWSDHGLLSWDRFLNEEAARREAEAKPTRQVDFQWCEKCPTVEVCQIGGCNGGEREGPGSAAAPAVEGLVAHAEVTADGELRLVTEEDEYMPPTFAHRETWEIVAIAMNQTADLLLNQNDVRYSLLHEFANKLGERSEELKEYAKTLPSRSESKPEDKPDPADDLVKRLQTRALEASMYIDVLARKRVEWEAADRIEAQARDLEGIYKALATHGVRGPEIHNAADGIAAMRRALDEQMARVRELERECGQWQEASGQANVRAEQLEDKWEAEKARADGLAADVAELVAALAEARDMVASWGAYASDYFKDKHGLSDDLAKLDAALAKHKGGA